MVTADRPDGSGQSVLAYELVVDPTIDLLTGVLDTGYAGRAPFSQTVALEAPAGAELSATLADGAALPAWLVFDAATRTFSGHAPDRYIGELSVIVTATFNDPATGTSSRITTGAALLVDPPLQFSGGASLFREGDNIRIATPEDFFGSIALRYKAEDIKGAASEDWAVAVVNILPMRELPTASDDALAATEDTPVTWRISDLIANDVDKDGDRISLVSVTQPLHGMVQLLGDPLVFALPASATAGLASSAITFSALLANGGPLPDWLAIDPATGILTGLPPLNFAGEIAVSVTADDGAQTVTSNHAIAASVNDHYRIVYTPDAQYSGPDSFTYTITDEREGLAMAAVDVHVRPINDPPVAVPDDLTTVEDTQLAFTAVDILANDTDVDGDPLRLVSVDDPAHGAITRDGDRLVYTPDHNFDGDDLVRYAVTDDADGSSFGTIRIRVTPDNKAPVTAADLFAGFEDQPVIVTVQDLIGNDYDPDGDAIAFAGVREIAPHGRAYLLPDGRISLTPDADFVGEVRFAYQITDGRLTTPADVQLNGPDANLFRNITVTFAAVNDAPVLMPDGGFVMDEDTVLAIPAAALLANDFDKESDALTVVGVGDPVNGTVTLDNGLVHFTPRADYFGNAGFSYTVRDAQGGEATNTVSIDVTPGNDLPIATPDIGFETLEEVALLIDPARLLANDLDLDGDAIVFRGVSGVELLADGMISLHAVGQ